MNSPFKQAEGDFNIAWLFGSWDLGIRCSFHRFGVCIAIVLFSAFTLTSTIARAVEFGKYSEFTLYNADEGELKKEVILVFHGFASAMPNGVYKRLSGAFKKRFSIIGFNYDYFDIEANNKAFSIIWNELLVGKKVIAAGTSLGGFWANYYASKYKINKVLVVNPVTDPTVQLRQFIGRHYVAKRQKEIVVNEEKVERYRNLATPVGLNTSRLILLTRDDPVLDYQLALDKFSGKPLNQVIVFDKGGHTLNLREPRFMSAINRFLSVDP